MKKSESVDAPGHPELTMFEVAQRKVINTLEQKLKLVEELVSRRPTTHVAEPRFTADIGKIEHLENCPNVAIVELNNLSGDLKTATLFGFQTVSEPVGSILGGSHGDILLGFNTVERLARAKRVEVTWLSRQRGIMTDPLVTLIK